MAAPRSFRTPQDDEPPQVSLLIKASQDLADMVRNPDRSNADLVRAVDALGRALLRLKAYLQHHPEGP